MYVMCLYAQASSVYSFPLLFAAGVQGDRVHPFPVQQRGIESVASPVKDWVGVVQRRRKEGGNAGTLFAVYFVVRSSTHTAGR